MLPLVPHMVRRVFGPPQPVPQAREPVDYPEYNKVAAVYNKLLANSQCSNSSGCDKNGEQHLKEQCKESIYAKN